MMKKHDLECVRSFLMQKTVKEIKFLAFILGCELKSNMKKAQMASELSNYIINFADLWLRLLPQRELSLLDMLTEQKKGSVYRSFPHPYRSVLSELGFVTEIMEDDCTTFALVPELYDSIKLNLAAAMSFKEVDNWPEFEELFWGILNIYGVVEFDKIMDIFIEVYDTDDGDSQMLSQAMQFLLESLLVKATAFEHGGKPYHGTLLATEAIDDVFADREAKPEIKDYRPFSKDEFLMAGQEPFFPFVGEVDSYASKLLDFFEEVGVEIDDYDVYGAVIWRKAQVDGMHAPLEAIHIFDDKLKNPVQLHNLMEAIKEYMNNVPRWGFKGYSSRELSEKFGIRQQRPEGISDKMPSMGFGLGVPGLGVPGLGVPRVGRNDPCPCGSGLKYKNCHGKYDN